MNESECCAKESRPEPCDIERSYGEVCAPDTPDRNRARPICIEELDYGYLVKVGCQTVVIEKTEKLIKVLSQYLTDPQATEKLYHMRKLL